MIGYSDEPLLGINVHCDIPAFIQDGVLSSEVLEILEDVASVLAHEVNDKFWFLKCRHLFQDTA